LRKRRLDGDFPVADAMAVLDELSTLDTRNDRQRDRYRKAIWACGAVGIAFLFIGLAWLSPLFFAAVVVLAILRWRLGRADIPNDALEVVRGWLRILAADIEAEQPITLKLDFGPAIAKAHCVYDQKVDRVRCREYLHPWYSAEAELADGARLQCDATTRVRERIIRKYSRSGKVKTKRKYKYWTKLDVTLGVPKDSFALTDDKRTGRAKVRSKAGEKRNVVRVSRVLADLPSGRPRLEDFIQTVAMAYRQVAPAPAPEQPA
jgi:hypothetical protein